MRVFISGHTGFKGSWMSAWLTLAGHEVFGYSIDVAPNSLFAVTHLDRRLAVDTRGDVRDLGQLRAALLEARPDIVVHLAAQPLVLESYRRPRWTFETNVTGTMNVLEAASGVESLRGILIVTSDKVYRNTGTWEGYREDAALGGSDPYSASKAMADILAQSWSHSFNTAPTAIARAGNVIGGGDWSAARLVPDLIRAFTEGRVAGVRNPHAVRPWQHVMDCLNAYMLIIDGLARGSAVGPWNVGPTPEGRASVREVADLAVQAWGEGASWVQSEESTGPEAAILTLDSSQARTSLRWSDALPLESAVAWTTQWSQSVLNGEDPWHVTERQIRRYHDLLSDSGIPVSELSRSLISTRQ